MKTIIILTAIEAFLVVVILEVASKASDDWACKTQATTRTSESFHSCGVAWAKDENTARLQAFENAKTEFVAICQASDDCVGHSVKVDPTRTDCSPELHGVRCYRMIVFTILGPISVASKSDEIKPYRGKSIASPEITKGMSKKDLLEKFGTPYSIDQNIYGAGQPGYNMFHYNSKMCTFDYCTVVIHENVVVNYDSIKPEFTDLLK